MSKGKKIFSIMLVFIMVFSSMALFADNDEGELRWIEEPTIGQVKNKKFEVNGRLEIPKEHKGNTKVKLTVDGFNVVPKNDGSFSKSVFVNDVVEVKVFVGKEEVTNLDKTLYYLTEPDQVEKVIDIISELPDLEDIRVSHKEAIIDARIAYEALTDVQKSFVKNIGTLIRAEEKIAYLENEKSSDIRYAVSVPQLYDLFDDSTVHFEGHFHNVEHLDKQ